MATETLNTMDAVLKIGYLGKPSKGETALQRLRRRRLVEERIKTERAQSPTRMVK